jgi:hypothetical protein
VGFALSNGQVLQSVIPCRTAKKHEILGRGPFARNFSWCPKIISFIADSERSCCPLFNGLFQSERKFVF